MWASIGAGIRQEMELRKTQLGGGVFDCVGRTLKSVPGLALLRAIRIRKQTQYMLHQVLYK